MKKMSGIRWLKVLRGISGVVILAHLIFFSLMGEIFTGRIDLVKNYTGYLLPSLIISLMVLVLSHVLIKKRQDMTTPRRGKPWRSSRKGRAIRYVTSWEK